LPRWVLAGLILVMSALLTVGAACGKSGPGSLTAIKDKGEIVVGTSADYPPFEFVNESGEYDGFDVALFREIGNRMGVEVKIQDMEFSVLISALKQGKIDAIIACMTVTPERDEQVDFTIPYYNSGDAVLIKRGSSINLETVEDVAAYRVGVQTGTIHEEWVRDNLVVTGKMDAAGLIAFPRADQAVMDLENGQVDVVIMDLAAAKKYMNVKEVEKVMELDLSGGDPAVAVKEGARDLQKALNRIIEDLKKEGFIDQLEQDYILSTQ